GIVVPLVGEAHRDAVLGERPELLDQPVVELLRPFAGEEADDLLPPTSELGAIAPIAVRRIGQRHALRIAGIPGILGGAHLLDRGFAREWRKWWATLGHDFSLLVGVVVAWRRTHSGAQELSCLSVRANCILLHMRRPLFTLHDSPRDVETPSR